MKIETISWTELLRVCFDDYVDFFIEFKEDLTHYWLTTTFNHLLNNSISFIKEVGRENLLELLHLIFFLQLPTPPLHLHLQLLSRQRYKIQQVRQVLNIFCILLLPTPRLARCLLLAFLKILLALLVKFSALLQLLHQLAGCFHLEFKFLRFDSIDEADLVGNFAEWLLLLYFNLAYVYCRQLQIFHNVNLILILLILDAKSLLWLLYQQSFFMFYLHARRRLLILLRSLYPQRLAVCLFFLPLWTFLGIKSRPALHSAHVLTLVVSHFWCFYDNLRICLSQPPVKF